MEATVFATKPCGRFWRGDAACGPPSPRAPDFRSPLNGRRIVQPAAFANRLLAQFLTSHDAFTSPTRLVQHNTTNERREQQPTAHNETAARIGAFGGPTDDPGSSSKSANRARVCLAANALIALGRR